MMRPVLLVILPLMIFLSPHGRAKVIYGEDNRLEVSEAPKHLQKLAKSTAVLISVNDLYFDPEKLGVMQVNQTTMADWLSIMGSEDKSAKLYSSKSQDSEELNYCPEERFTDQPNPGKCTGFLIGPDLLVTAGHCVELEDFCEKYRWVFDFKLDPKTYQAGIDVPQDNIYACSKVISGSLSTSLETDYGLIQLDRPVGGRAPLKFNNSVLKDDAELVLIGSPNGLPLKIAQGAKVRDNSHPFYFTSNTDSFQGNSGSPVINADTLEVEGILVRGEEDFVTNPEFGCVESNRCTEDDCRGEDVSRMTSIPEIGVQAVFNQAAYEGDLETLKSIINFGTWIDFYSHNGQTALMKAAQGGQIEAMRLLIEHGADPRRQDAKGRTAIKHLLKSRNISLFKKFKFLNELSQKRP